MKKAKMVDTVKVHYRGKLEDGKIFGTTANHGPMQLKIGDGKVIPGLEEAIIGMAPGEIKTARIPAEKAYGPHDDDLVMVVDRKSLPAYTEPKIGQRLQSRQADGRTAEFTVIDISDSSLKLDANHPLAGKDLTFDIRLLKII